MNYKLKIFLKQSDIMFALMGIIRTFISLERTRKTNKTKSCKRS